MTDTTTRPCSACNATLPVAETVPAWHNAAPYVCRDVNACNRRFWGRTQ